MFFFVPDISAAGYLLNPKIGAQIYNVLHSYPIPSIFLAYGLIFHMGLSILIALLLFAHIGFDRALGYGLKFTSGFKNTHLGTIGAKGKKGKV